jgi:hypothetical protein
MGLRIYIFRLGFIDQRTGFILAVANAAGLYYGYPKPALLAEKRERNT